MKKLNKTTVLLALSTLALGLLIGWLLFGRSDEVEKDEHNHVASSGAETIWTCSMHPQIRKNEPGDCPICGMDLIPLESESNEIDPMAVSMSPTAIQLAQVETMTVGASSAEKTIQLNGKVQADERLLFTQSSHIPGRIESLEVNFTGDFVTKGQIIAHVYSPELVIAQEELLEAQKIKDSQSALFNAAKEKLKNWKLTELQINKVLSSGKTTEQFPVLANVSGYVTKKMVNLGDYIKQGEPIYEIADLSKVWVLFDVYESDMNWIKKGSAVIYTVRSVPGKTFNGTINYIDPVIDPRTRVAKARVEQINPNLRLKSEMFASGIVEAKITSAKNAITVPKSAVMWTGKRSVVYVMQNTAQGINFKMREVTLGPELGESYVIESGLQAGEEIAVHGTFSIDAAAQLAGKPSMMNHDGGVAMSGHDHGNKHSSSLTNASTSAQKFSIPENAKAAIVPLFNSYFKMKSALVNDDVESAKEAGHAIRTALREVDMNLFKGNAHTFWMQQKTALKNELQDLEGNSNIEAVRMNFIDISNSVIAIAESFEPLATAIYIQHCPMANSNQGADWLSREKEIRNPYFGESMLTCGEVTKTIK